MVLIQTVSVDAINTALIALQRGQSIVIGGDKGQTVNNINVTNKSEGADYSEKIKELTRQIETLKETDTVLKAEDVRINDRLNALTQLGISDFYFDDSTRELTIELTDGNVYTTIIRPVPFILSLDGNTLVLENEYQREEVELPFILSSEKGVANGVATLDATGRVPYSQLPESAMEFKGEWNASTNTPHLQDGTGTNGDFYICSQGGTVNFGTSASPRNITFYINDRVIYQGDAEQWKRLPASEVRTVNGQSGDVVLDGEDINYSSASGSPTIKAKIDSVETKAETQSDWGQSNTSAIDYIKNKPNLATVATSGSYNDLSNKPTIPAAQIQSDWTQTDSTKKDFIKNKIPIWITSGSADDNMSPIDSVTNGNTRPVTSNAVYDAISYCQRQRLIEVYSYSTWSSGYWNILTVSSWESTGNHDVAISGIFTHKTTAYPRKFFFQIAVRGQNTNVSVANFTMLKLSGSLSNFDLIATRKVVGTRLIINLYIPITANWVRDTIKITDLMVGDVYPTTPLIDGTYSGNLTLQDTHVASIPTDETQITLTNLN